MVQKQLVMVSLAFANFLQTLVFWGMLCSFWASCCCSYMVLIQLLHPVVLIFLYHRTFTILASC
jgi:hypothetical protein